MWFTYTRLVFGCSDDAVEEEPGTKDRQRVTSPQIEVRGAQLARTPNNTSGGDKVVGRFYPRGFIPHPLCGAYQAASKLKRKASSTIRNQHL